MIKYLNHKIATFLLPKEIKAFIINKCPLCNNPCYCDNEIHGYYETIIQNCENCNKNCYGYFNLYQNIKVNLNTFNIIYIDFFYSKI